MNTVMTGRDGLKSGDILLSKSFSIIGWLIGNAFHEDSPLVWHMGTEAQKKRPSGHNGIVGVGKKGDMVVFESLTSGFVETPLKSIEDGVIAGNREVKFARLEEGLSPEEMFMVEMWTKQNVGTGYDFRAYISMIWRVLLRQKAIFNSSEEGEFYCTEAVRDCYKSMGKDFYHKSLPTPFTTEKRVKQGKLRIVSEWYRE